MSNVPIADNKKVHLWPMMSLRAASPRDRPPEGDHRRDHEAIYLDVERIEGPAAKTGPHGAAFSRVQIAEPSEHRVSPSCVSLQPEGSAQASVGEQSYQEATL